MEKNGRTAASPEERARTAAKTAVADLAGPLLRFLSADDGRFDRFLALTGLTAGTLRDASRDAAFPGHLLDYVSSDEGLLLAFAGENDIDPARLAALRRAAATLDEG